MGTGGALKYGTHSSSVLKAFRFECGWVRRGAGLHAKGGMGDLVDNHVAILEAERILKQVVVYEEPCDTLEEIVDESERDVALASEHGGHTRRGGSGGGTASPATAAFNFLRARLARQYSLLCARAAFFFSGSICPLASR